MWAARAIGLVTKIANFKVTKTVEALPFTAASCLDALEAISAVRLPVTSATRNSVMKIFFYKVIFTWSDVYR
jgi:hypothetical protein